jgi:hypothetical protein
MGNAMFMSREQIEAQEEERRRIENERQRVQNEEAERERARQAQIAAERRRIENERQRVQNEEAERERARQAQIAAERRRIENERQRVQNEEAERERARQAQIAAERRRIELDRERILQELRDGLVYESLEEACDNYIRTRNRFDGRDPLSYHCPVNSIEQDPNVIYYLNQFNNGLSAAGLGTIDLQDFFNDTIPEFEYESDFDESNGAYGVSTLTPWRIKKEYAYGFFKCGSCRFYWQSADTWIDSAQDCPFCSSLNYPLKQETIEDILLAKKNLAVAVDLFIRTRNQFNSTRPLDISVTIDSIQQERRIMSLLNEFNASLGGITTINNFIMDQHRFISRASRVSLRYLTPFKGQDSHRVFGKFKCGNCHRKWDSAASWTDKWQKCKRCESKCYPYEQFPLENDSEDEEVDDNHNDSRRPHDCERCQKCRELGRICLPHMYFAI